MDIGTESDTPKDFLSLDPLKRFSSRAALYANRARYPDGLKEYLRGGCGFAPGLEAADVGAGTGFLTAMLLEIGCRVYAVEPNAEMRSIAEESFKGNTRFISMEGQAECLPLPDASVDAVTVGQALHWFDIDKARPEFMRVLRQGGWVVIVDNRPREDASPLMQACRDLQQRYFTDLGKSPEPPPRVVKLFEGMEMRFDRIPFAFPCSEQVFRDGTLSSSLAPAQGSPALQQSTEALHEVFMKYQVDGRVELLFETVIYCGRLKG
jgi:ubiquinone/menaquinone biosynthesis C-methylase UbiE